MMNTRAKASIALERNAFTEAGRLIEKGIEKIRAFFAECGNAEMEAQSHELGFLSEWLAEIRSREPVTPLEKLQRELDEAIATEAYERAAELRDAIRDHLQAPTRE
jgi:excinuclease UvrABC helicase subunit UvrB